MDRHWTSLMVSRQLSRAQTLSGADMPAADLLCHGTIVYVAGAKHLVCPRHTAEFWYYSWGSLWQRLLARLLHHSLGPPQSLCEDHGTSGSSNCCTSYCCFDPCFAITRTSSRHQVSNRIQLRHLQRLLHLLAGLGHPEQRGTTCIFSLCSSSASCLHATAMPPSQAELAQRVKTTHSLKSRGSR
jgi:hypothetical protein